MWWGTSACSLLWAPLAGRPLRCTSGCRLCPAPDGQGNRGREVPLRESPEAQKLKSTWKATILFAKVALQLVTRNICDQQQHYVVL